MADYQVNVALERDGVVLQASGHLDVRAVRHLLEVARIAVFDVVAGLEAGADDNLTKPFEPKELAARIRAHLRRARGLEEPSSVIRLLCELAASPGRVLTREMLLERVWGYDYFGDGKLVDVHIYRLRAKIEADPANPRHVVTARGLGYRVVP